MIVITGPNGNVGTELVRMMAAQTELPFRIAAHSPDKIRRLYGADVQAVKFDYADRGTWAGVLAGISTLFLLFPLPHPRTARTWMVPFVEAAKAAGVRHIVYVSVPGADTLKMVPHYTVERAIEATGVPYTILRASYFAQNLVRDITTHSVDIAKYGEIFIPAKGGKTSFIDSRDMASVAIDVFRHPDRHANRAYVLTGPEPLDFHQVAAMLTEELGRPVRYADPSMPRFWWRMHRRGVPFDTLFFMTIVYGLTRGGKNAPMTDTLPRLLGRPATGMRQFIRDYRDRFTPEAADALLAARPVSPGLFGHRHAAKTHNS
ncbi:MAG: hypothetical protein RLY86_1318 [Pseudomonadota bacterium]|jgi:uncharacterized protein YbjT (DUF2867 family)